MVSHHDHTESFHGPHMQAELVCSDIANRLDLTALSTVVVFFGICFSLLMAGSQCGS